MLQIKTQIPSLLSGVWMSSQGIWRGAGRIPHSGCISHTGCKAGGEHFVRPLYGGQGAMIPELLAMMSFPQAGNKK